MEEIRLLSKEDIDVRVAQTTAYSRGADSVVKATLLLYKNARVDMKILDELFTPMGWKRSHKLIGDRLYCQVEVWDESKKQWIVKEDVGVESNTEAEKGQASDSFKRACVNWGIGRELYTAPKISVTLNDREYTKDQNGRIKVWASFSVANISYDTKARAINALTIVDKNGVIRFSYPDAAQQATPSPTPEVVSSAAQARKAARKKKTKPLDTDPAYMPMPEADYQRVVALHAIGKQTKDGGNYRQSWIDYTHAKAEHIAKFDDDVMTYKINNNLM